MDINQIIQTAGQTVQTMYGATAVKIALLVVALLFCFAGYKLLRGVTALLGVVLGVACGTCIPGLLNTSMTPFMEMIVTILGMVVLGIVCGVICFKFYQLGVFLVFAVIGIGIVYVPALFVAERSMEAFWVVLAIGAVLFGVTSVLFLRPLSILLTSCLGFVAAMPMLDLLQGQIGEQPQWVTVALGAVLTVLGFAAQLVTNRRTNAQPFGASDDEDDEETDEEQPEDTDAAPQPDAVDGVSDSTQVLDMSELPQEEPDEIDSISDLIAARIGLADPETQPLTEANVSGMTHPMDEPMTQPLEQQTEPELTQPLTQQSEPEEPEEPEQAQDEVQTEPETEPEIEPETEPEAEPEMEQETEPEASVDPVTRLLDAMRPQARVTVPAADIEPEETVAEPEEVSTEPAEAAPEEPTSALDMDEPTVTFETVQPEEVDEPTKELQGMDALTQLLKDIAPAEQTSEPTEPLSDWQQLNQIHREQPEQEEPELEQTEPAEPAEAEPEQPEQSEPEEEPESEQTEQAEPEEEPEPEQTEQAEPAEPEPEQSEPETDKPRKKRTNPLCIIPAALLTAGALAAATFGFQYVEIVLAIGALFYLVKWYRTAAFACAILCVRRVVDIVMLMQASDTISFGWNQATLDLLLDGVSGLALLLLTFVAVQSYVKVRHTEDE